MKKQGFSLLELMVVVLITSIVVIAGFSLMISTRDGFRNESDRKELEANLRIAEQIVQRDLSRVGYHSLMDSRFGFDGQEEHIAGLNEFQSFVSYGRSNNCEQFGFLADLSNFTSGFPVSGQNAMTLTMADDGLESGRTAGQVKYLSDTAGATLDSAKPLPVSPADYPTEFIKAFRHAKALFAFSPDNMQTMVGVTSVNTQSNTITISANPPASLGFQPVNPLAGVSVYPVVGIVYRIATENGHPMLQRCYANSMQLELEDVNNNDCQVLIRHLKQFELYPIMAGNQSSLNSFFSAANDGVYLQSGKHWMDMALGAGMETSVTKIVGFVYRIEAAGARPANGVSGQTPGYDENGYPVSVVQGTVMLTTKNSFRPNGKSIRKSSNN